MNEIVGRYLDDIEVGLQFERTTTITEAHIVMAAGLFGDFAPLHVNQTFAESTRFGTRIAHGPLIVGLLAGTLSTYFHGTAIGYLEERLKFVGPSLPGDSVTCSLRVSELTEKPKLGGGIVRFEAVAINQHGNDLVTGEVRAIIRSRDSGTQT